MPTVRRTWGPRGKTPFFYHLYKQDRISAISALTVSPKRKRIALYIRYRSRNINGLDVRAFLALLLKHLRGPVVLLWDRSPIHRRKEVKQFVFDHPRLHIEFFPAYAPELNPAEYVWNQTDRSLANSAPEDLAGLRGMLRSSQRRIRGSQRLLWSCIYASDLPWVR
ncbi:MAG: transposase [Candidatus Zixiibacteriota bacterium]